MGFNSGFKGLIYIVHLVGYFHSCITMHGIRERHGSLIVTVRQRDGCNEGNSRFFPQLFCLRSSTAFVSSSWCQQQRSFPTRWGEFWNNTASCNAIRQNASEYWHHVAAPFVAELKHNRHFDSECISTRQILHVKQKTVGHNSLPKWILSPVVEPGRWSLGIIYRVT